MRSFAIVRLYGGLGNIMFQFGWGRYVESTLGRSVKYDVTLQSVRAVTALEAWLGPDNALQRCTPLERFLSVGMLPIGKAGVRQLPFLKSIGSPISNARTFSLIPDEAEVRRARYFSGYFQHIDLVEHVRRALRNAIDPAINQWRDRFEKRFGRLPISVHVRLGDYFHEAQRRTHGITEASYFQRAFEYIAANSGDLADAPILLFSNEPEKAREMIGGGMGSNTIVNFSNNWKVSDSEEMLAMAACGGHIIANSTFSYWGAAFAATPGLKIAPRQWFADPALNTIADQLFDTSWKRV